MSNSSIINERVEEVFGRSPTLDKRIIKLFEEVGELSRAVLRHEEGRVDKDWHAEIETEMKDVFVVMHTIAHRVGLSLDVVYASTPKYLLERTWKGMPSNAATTNATTSTDQ